MLFIYRIRSKNAQIDIKFAIYLRPFCFFPFLIESMEESFWYKVYIERFEQMIQVPITVELLLIERLDYTLSRGEGIIIYPYSRYRSAAASNMCLPGGIK